MIWLLQTCVELTLQEPLYKFQKAFEILEKCLNIRFLLK